MGNTQHTIDPWRGLTHPGWWGALGLLALNDHVLKGSGLLPGAVTGKLSDVAGMAAAPVLAAALLGARSRHAVAGAFALVAVGFAAIKVSHAASALYLGALALVGVHGHNAVDPTDLLALAALPLAWRLCVTAPTGSRRVALQRLAVALGGLACVATSQIEPMPGTGQWSTSAIVANNTREAVEVRLRWIDGQVACSDRGSARGVFLRSGFTSEPLTVRLTAGQTFPLSRAAALRAIMPATGGAWEPAPTTVTACDAVLVQADNLPSTVVWLSRQSVSAPVRWSASGDSGSDAVPALVLDGDATALTARVVDGLVSAPPAEEPAACGEATTRYFVAADFSVWNGLAVTSVSVQPDGCTRLGAAGAASMTLCVPEDAVPFRVGDALTAGLRQGIWTLRAERGAQLVVVPSAPYTPELAALSLRSSNSSCRAHSACGAFFERIAVSADGAPLRLNERTELRGARVYFGGAELPVVRPSACGPTPLSQTEPTTLYNLAIVTGL